MTDLAVTIQVCQSTEELPSDSLQLFVKAESVSPEFSFDWFANIQRTVFHEDPGVRFYIARRADRVVAILPVRRVSKGAIRQIEALGNYYTSLYTPILADDASVADLVGILTAALHDDGTVHALRFAPMASNAPAYAMLQSALRHLGWTPFQFYCFGNWYLEVTSDWKTYLEQRDGQLRSTLRRKGRKFLNEGGQLEIITDPVKAETVIADFNHVYSRSWKKPEPYPQFIPGLIRWLAGKGWLRLGIARLNGQPIATQLWIVHAGKASIFKLAYDEAHGQHAPGTLLTARLMEYVIDRDNVTEVDYLIGDDEHKKLWMNRRRERWGLVAYNPVSFVGLGLLTREIAGRNIRKITSMHTKPALNRIRWELIPSSRFKEFSEQWNALQRKSANLPFLESDFITPLLDEFGTGHELLAFGYDGETPCAATILFKKRFGIWQTFQPSQLPLGAWIAVPNADLALLGKTLLEALPGFNLNLSLTQIDPLFQSRPENESCIRSMDYIDTAWVDIDQSFDAYWESRGKNLKTNTRKQRSKLQTDEVHLALDCITCAKDVALAIANYGTLESAGWKGKDGTAVHPGNAQGRFYQKMLENFCNRGKGRIYQYRFNDKVVAMDLCIESGDRIVILKTAYDETFKTISPSTLMRQEQFREFFDGNALKRIEFYGKVMEWHTRWTDHKRTLFHTTIYRSDWLAKLHQKRVNINAQQT